MNSLNAMLCYFFLSNWTLHPIYLFDTFDFKTKLGETLNSRFIPSPNSLRRYEGQVT
jgi:hypothetical protein